MVRAWLKFVCFVAIFLGVAVFGGQLTLQKLYPISYVAEIEHWSEQAGVDPYLTAALIQVESGFRPEAVSPKGALGLMQLMPDTAAWVGERYNIGVDQPEDLFDPALNIRIGTLYLGYLLSRFSTEAAALAAYNGGLGNVSRWLAEGIWDGQLETVNQIPFRETRSYVRKLKFTTEFLRLIYCGQW